MSKLRFTFACSPYDRMQPLLNGTIVPEGMDFNFIPLEVEEIFWRRSGTRSLMPVKSPFRLT